MQKDNNEEKIYTIDELNLKQHSFMVIASKRASGKSVLNRNLIKYMLDKHEYDFVMLFSDTAGFNDDYNFIDKDLIFKSELIDEKIGKLLKIQEKSRKNKNNVYGLVILDDVKTFNRSKMLIQLATQGRHFYLTVIASVQYPKELISSSIRSNIDYLFWSDLNEQALQAVFQSIHVPMNFKNFNKFVDHNNTNYQFIFYDSRNPDKNDRLKVIKAKEFTNMKMDKK